MLRRTFYLGSSLLLTIGGCCLSASPSVETHLSLELVGQESQTFAVIVLHRSQDSPLTHKLAPIHFSGRRQRSSAPLFLPPHHGIDSILIASSGTHPFCGHAVVYAEVGDTVEEILYVADTDALTSPLVTRLVRVQD